MIFDIDRNSFVDGPGIRTVVFFKGCNLKCEWCHNPESQDPGKELMFYENKCVHCGKCKEVCPNGLKSCTLCGRCAESCPTGARMICGKDTTPDEILEIIMKGRKFFDNSGGGVTFSGGECMLRTDELLYLLKKCKEAGIHTAVDTAGNVPWKEFEKVIPYTDLFLYDIKTVSPEKHKRYTGVPNELILGNLRRLFEAGKSVMIRIPLIKGVNDDDEEMLAVKELLSPYTPAGIELLPYHTMGNGKYAALGRTVTTFGTPDDARIEHLKTLLGISD